MPDNFVYGGIVGNSNTWKDIGNWNSNLIIGLNDLPVSEIQKIQELTKQSNNDYEKVKLIYEYLQNETRYVGVFIGIGGFKPYSASYVCNKKYGDCKALTNYMLAMLKSVGIKSYYSLIVADEKKPDIDTNFPGMYFNHAVLCVPLKNDTLWLECTDQLNPFNYWGSFTNGKHALVCDFEFSFITQTPKFTHHTNCVIQNSIVNFKEGKLLVSMERQLFGEAFEEVRNNLKYNSDKNIIEMATKTLPFRNYTLSSVNYNEIYNNGVMGYNESLQLICSNYLQVFDSSIIISQFNKIIENQFHLSANRQNTIEILHNYRVVDTIKYHIPDEFGLEVLPNDFYSSTSYGKCEVKYLMEENKLIICKFVELNKGVYSSTIYNEFKKFISDILHVENQKNII